MPQRGRDPIQYHSKFGNDLMSYSGSLTSALQQEQTRNARSRSHGSRSRSGDSRDRRPRYPATQPATTSASHADLPPPDGSTSFRERIEGLLPDRLKTQYHIQKQLNRFNAPMEEINEESNSHS